MARVIFLVAIACCIGSMALAEQPHRTAYFYPVEHRSDLSTFKEFVPSDTYDYTIIPNDENAVTEYDALNISLWDFLPSPITVVSTVASKALSAVRCVTSKALKVVKFVVPKVILVGLGVALVIGFCAFTPYCTLIIEKPFLRELRSMENSYPYLEYAEEFLVGAYNKYRKMREV